MLYNTWYVRNAACNVFRWYIEINGMDCFNFPEIMHKKLLLRREQIILLRTYFLQNTSKKLLRGDKSFRGCPLVE